MGEDNGELKGGEQADEAHLAIEEALEDAHRYLKRHWGERPVTVVAAALGAGLVLGLLLRGRR